MGELARTTNGCESWCGHQSIPRHRHGEAYCALVLSGSYEECGSRGRFRVGPGDVLLHGEFDAHLNRFAGSGALLLNLVMPAPAYGSGRVEDPDAIARAAERDPAGACKALSGQLRETEPAAADWPDLLARDLMADSAVCLSDWAQAHGLAPETVSRGFAKVFAVTPAQFRSEAMTRRAYGLLQTGASLAAVAAGAGFADQAHLSRAMRAMTGQPPGALRRSNRFKTAAATAA